MARRRLESLPGLAVESDPVSDELWLRIDSFAMIQAFTFLSDKLRAEYGVRRVHFRGAGAGKLRRARPRLGGRDRGERGAVAVGNAAARRGAAHAARRPRAPRRRGLASRRGTRRAAQRRVPLPPAGGRAGSRAEAAGARAESRPEYYDFDLFRYGDSARELDERRLSDLAYTVFDTETTGLEPRPATRSSASEPCAS